MKRVSKFLFLSLPCIALLASCSHHSSESPTSATFLTASSTAISSFSVTGTSLAAAGALGSKVQITGTSSGGDILIFNLKPCSATGTYAFNADSISASYSYLPTGASEDSIISSVHGTLDLTSVTPVIAGTYTFTGTDSAVFTGSFSVTTP